MSTINPNWIEIQTGLYQEIVNVSNITFSRLHSADGYCFYDLADEFYDEEGNLIPQENVTPEMRNYSIIAVVPTTDVDVLNARFVSVVREDWMNVLSNPNNDHEIM